MNMQWGSLKIQRKPMTRLRASADMIIRDNAIKNNEHVTYSNENTTAMPIYEQCVEDLRKRYEKDTGDAMKRNAIVM